MIQALTIALLLPHIWLFALMTAKNVRLVDIYGEGRFGGRVLTPAATQTLSPAHAVANSLLPTAIAFLISIIIIGRRIWIRRRIEPTFDVLVPLVLGALTVRGLQIGLYLVGV